MADVNLREMHQQNTARLHAITGWADSDAALFNVENLTARLREEMTPAGVRFDTADGLAGSIKHQIGQIITAHDELVRALGVMSGLLEAAVAARREAINRDWRHLHA